MQPVSLDSCLIGLFKKPSLCRKKTLIVAVSGGADSLLLTFLAAHALPAMGGRLIAVTVNHGLRSEAAAEARAVNRIVTSWSTCPPVAHHTLHLNLPPSTTAEKARIARYRALAAFCKPQGIHTVLLGHQQDDQMETWLMRMARSSTDYGLGGICTLSSSWGVQLWRPLLPLPRVWTHDLCRMYGLPFISDPSNNNKAFERVRVRHALQNMPYKGAHAFITHAARRHAEERSMHDAWAAHTLNIHATFPCKSTISIPLTFFYALPFYKQAILLRHMLMHCRPCAVRPLSLKRIQLCIHEHKPHKRQTLGGCLLCWGKISLAVMRDSA